MTDESLNRSEDGTVPTGGRARGHGVIGKLQQAEASLLELAAGILRLRTRSGPGHVGLSIEDQTELADYLTRLTTASTAASPAERRAAVAFAHRVVDDDHPELSPLWQERAHPTPDASSVGGVEVPDPRTLPDDGLGQGAATHHPDATRNPHRG